MDRREQLHDELVAEVLRVLPDFDGNEDEYAWLLANYGVTEEDDVKWQNVMHWEAGTFEEYCDHYDEEETSEWEAFLNDDAAVIAFLESMLARYRAGTAVYPAPNA